MPDDFKHLFTQNYPTVTSFLAWLVNFKIHTAGYYMDKTMHDYD